MARKNMTELTGRKLKSAAWTAAACLPLSYLGMRLGMLAESLSGKETWFMHLMDAIDRLPAALANQPLAFSTSQPALICAGTLAAVLWIVYLYYLSLIGNFRTGEESGSARWGTKKEGQAFKDMQHPENNLLFTENFGLALKKPKFDLDTDRNLNVCVIGGSGSGKTRNYVKPNLMQLNSNYFVTDPKGTLITETGYLFSENGYKIKCFNTIQFDRSWHYNPLKYVKTDADILSFVNCLIKNTTDEKKSGGDAFWENSERLLYTALIAILRDYFPASDYSLSGLLTLLSMAQAKDDDEDYKSPLDILFLEIETGEYPVVAAKENPNDPPKVVMKPSPMRRNSDGKKPADSGGFTAGEDFALANYLKFKTAAGKTLKSIIISCNVRLAPIEINEVRNILGDDEMELDKLGEKGHNAVIFAILSDTDRTFSFLHAILIWQTIDILCRKALEDYNGRLPKLVNFILDEFANIGTLPDIEKTAAVCRSRNIGLSLILQSVAQLEDRYDKAAKTIIDCCDTTLFLGGKSNSTNKEIAEMIGKQTIHQVTASQSSGQSPSTSRNMQIQGRDLIDAAEIGKMNRRKAILLIAGTDPLQDNKYPVEQHRNYKYIDPGHNGCKYGVFDTEEYKRQQAEAERQKQTL